MRQAIIITMLLVLLSASAVALRNPSAVYCIEMGYNYSVEKTSSGDQGICTLPDGTNADAWRFLEGKTGIRYNYCTQNNHATSMITDCGQLLSGECAACNVNGTNIEVTQLMKLNFAESQCGDGICGFPENNENCAKDCTAAMNAPEGHSYTWILIILAVAVVFVAAILLFRKKKKKHKIHKD
jgi:putative hemolysin